MARFVEGHALQVSSGMHCPAFMMSPKRKNRTLTIRATPKMSVAIPAPSISVFDQLPYAILLLAAVERRL